MAGMGLLIPGMLTAEQNKVISKIMVISNETIPLWLASENIDDLILLCFNILHHISSLMAIILQDRTFACHSYVTNVKFMTCQVLRKGALRQA
jgi:hypothetical protein